MLKISTHQSFKALVHWGLVTLAFSALMACIRAPSTECVAEVDQTHKALTLSTADCTQAFVETNQGSLESSVGKFRPNEDQTPAAAKGSDLANAGAPGSEPNALTETRSFIATKVTRIKKSFEHSSASGNSSCKVQEGEKVELKGANFNLTATAPRIDHISGQLVSTLKGGCSLESVFLYKGHFEEE